MTSDEKLWQRSPLAGVLQGVWSDGEVDRRGDDFRFLRLTVNDELTVPAQVFGQQRAFHVAAEGVLDVDEHAVVRLVQDFVAFCVQGELKGDLRFTSRDFSCFGHLDVTADQLDGLDRVVESLEDADALGAQLQGHHSLHAQQDAVMLQRLFTYQQDDAGHHFPFMVNFVGSFQSNIQRNAHVGPANIRGTLTEADPCYFLLN